MSIKSIEVANETGRLVPHHFFDPAERNSASVEAELRGQRRGYGQWKPTLELVTVRAVPGETVWERHPGHTKAGHAGGDVVIAQDVVSVALTPLVAEKLNEKVLFEATPNQVDAQRQRRAAQQAAAIAAFKERCKADFVKLTGSEEGFEQAFPKIREKRFLDQVSAA